jgi:hypothetical protein
MKILPFEKSCASNPELVKIWHTQNEFNPEQVYLKSCIKIKWNCFTCNHTYDQTVKNKNRNKFDCPYCAIPSKFYAIMIIVKNVLIKVVLLIKNI